MNEIQNLFINNASIPNQIAEQTTYIDGSIALTDGSAKLSTTNQNVKTIPNLYKSIVDIHEQLNGNMCNIGRHGITGDILFNISNQEISLLDLVENIKELNRRTAGLF